LASFGDFDREEVLKDVTERFGQWKTKASDLPKYSRPTLATTVRKTVAMPKEQAVVEIGFLGADLQSPDRDTLNVLRESVSGMGNRLFVRLRDELGLCYYTGASQFMGVDTGMFYFFVGTIPGKEQQCEQEIQKQIARLGEESITPEELTRAKAALLGRFTLSLQNSGGLAEGAAFDELFGLGYNFHKTYPHRVQSVTADQIKAAARKYFTGAFATIIVSREIGSEKKE
jgi:zinc protease